MRCSRPILLTAMIALSLSTGMAVLQRAHGIYSKTDPELVNLRPGVFSYRSSGEFTRDGIPTSAPVKTITLTNRLLIMKHQVTSAEYQRCVEARACATLNSNETAGSLPAVKMSWLDATAYAKWLSHASGRVYRLPTDEEWVYAAVDRFTDEDNTVYNGKTNYPIQRILANYTRDSDQQDEFTKKLQPVGSFGANENGLLDIAGNVWEWSNCSPPFEAQCDGLTRAWGLDLA